MPSLPPPAAATVATLLFTATSAWFTAIVLRGRGRLVGALLGAVLSAGLGALLLGPVPELLAAALLGGGAGGVAPGAAAPSPRRIASRDALARFRAGVGGAATERF